VFNVERKYVKTNNANSYITTCRLRHPGALELSGHSRSSHVSFEALGRQQVVKIICGKLHKQLHLFTKIQLKHKIYIGDVNLFHKSSIVIANE